MKRNGTKKGVKYMAFFDDLGKKFNDVVQSVQKTTDVAKVQRQINQKTAEFDSIYHQIGQLYYASRIRNTPPDPAIDALCENVTKLTKDIEALRARIDELQDVRRCLDILYRCDKNLKGSGTDARLLLETCVTELMLVQHSEKT